MYNNSAGYNNDELKMQCQNHMIYCWWTNKLKKKAVERNLFTDD